MKPLENSITRWISHAAPVRATFLLAGLAVTFLLVALLCGRFGEKQSERAAASFRAESEAVSVIDALARLTLEADTAFRGFILTRDTAFLRQYFEGRNRLSSILNEVESRAADCAKGELLAKVRQSVGLLTEHHDTIANVILQRPSDLRLDELVREDNQRLNGFQQNVADLRSVKAAHASSAGRARSRDGWLALQFGAVLLGAFTGCLGLVMLARHAASLKLHGAAHSTAAQQRDRKSGARLNAIVAAAAAVPIVTTTPDGIITGFNQGAELALGYSPGEMNGQSLFSILIHPEGDPAVLPALAASNTQAEWSCVRKDGVRILLKTSVRAIHDGNDELIGYAAVGIDITAECHYRTLFDAFMKHTPALNSVKDELGRIVYLNPACEQVWRTSSDVKGKLDFELLPLNMAQHVRANDATVLESGEPDNRTESYTVPGGEQRIFQSHRFPLRLPDHETLIGNVSVDITERALLEQQLSRMKDELVSQTERAWKTTRVKDTFLACMSHEIRTPVNAMLGMADLLWETVLDDEQRTCVRIFRSNADQLIRIVNDILDLAKVESGEMRIASERLDLAALVYETVELLRGGAQAKGLSLTATLPPGIRLGLLGDATRIRQILVNLVGNAIKFTEEGGVSISVIQDADDSDFFRFEVADSGQGIPPGSEQSIFRPFVQCDPSLTRRNAGAGLGLSICQRLTDLMGGTIGFERTSANGSAFWFRIPLRRDPTLADVTGLQETRGAETSGRLPALALGASNAVRVLLVDDSPDNAFLVRRQLRNEPVHLDVVSTGEEALDKVKREQFDLILMDLVMPGIDGHTATRWIREWEKCQMFSPTPIVALTAHALEEEVQKSLDAGCDAHMTKPIRRAALIDTITRYGRAPHRPSARILSELRDIMPEFMERRWEDIETFRRALESGDYSNLYMVAHNLKGCGGGFGFQPITDIGSSLEQAVTVRDEAEIARSIDALATYLQHVDVEYVREGVQA